MEPLRTGERYTAWGKFVFIMIPVSLVSCAAATAGAKLLFGPLSYHARSGHCFARDETLGRELAASIYQVRRWRRELETLKLVEYDPYRHGDNYHFLFHAILTASLRPLARTNLRNLNQSSSEAVSAIHKADSATRNVDSAIAREAYKEEEIPKTECGKREGKIDRANAPASEPSKEDIEFVRKHLESFQAWISTPLDEDPNTISMVLRIAEAHGFPLYRLGAELYRLSKVVARCRRRATDTIESWRYVVRALREQIAS